MKVSYQALFFYRKGDETVAEKRKDSKGRLLKTGESLSKMGNINIGTLIQKENVKQYIVGD